MSTRVCAAFVWAPQSSALRIVACGNFRVRDVISRHRTPMPVTVVCLGGLIASNGQKLQVDDDSTEGRAWRAALSTTLQWFAHELESLRDFPTSPLHWYRVSEAQVSDLVARVCGRHKWGSNKTSRVPANPVSVPRLSEAPSVLLAREVGQGGPRGLQGSRRVVLSRLARRRAAAALPLCTKPVLGGERRSVSGEKRTTRWQTIDKVKSQVASARDELLRTRRRGVPSSTCST